MNITMNQSIDVPSIHACCERRNVCAYGIVMSPGIHKADSQSCRSKASEHKSAAEPHFKHGYSRLRETARFEPIFHGLYVYYRSPKMLNL